MTNEIIQHHEPFDFFSFYENVRSGYVGIDFADFEMFMHAEGEKHSFIATAMGADRVSNALKAIKAAGKGIVDNATKVLLTVVHCSVSEDPIKVVELQHITDFISELAPDSEVSWAISDDSSLGCNIRVILLVSIEKH